MRGCDFASVLDRCYSEGVRKVSKGDLLVMYDLTYYTLRKFLGEELMTELDWMPLQTRRKISRVTMFYKM